MNTDHLIADLETCGWFSDIPAADAAALKAKLSFGECSESNLHLGSVIIENPDHFEVDGSLMESDPEGEITSYEDLLRAYAKASSGEFAPEAIVEEVDDQQNQLAIGFLTEGRIHALFIPGAPRFDLEINDLVNEALDLSGAKKRFFVLPTPDETVSFAFITPAVFERACQMGIIPLQEDLFSELYGDGLGEPAFAQVVTPESRTAPTSPLATA